MASGQANMAITYLKLKIKNPEKPRRAMERRFLVDSGALYSVVPAALLKSLGISPTRRQEFMLANGEIIERDVGNAYFEYRGNVAAAPVVFGDKGVFLLGATTLEAFGMFLDPISRKLKPMPMVLM